MMFRKAISILLICSFLISTANFVFPFASYYANYQYFSAVVCIHKDHPEMHCNGSCQLKRMLKKENKDATTNSKAKVDHSIRMDIYCSLCRGFLIPPVNHKISYQMSNDRISSLYNSEPLSPPPRFG